MTHSLRFRATAATLLAGSTLLAACGGEKPAAGGADTAAPATVAAAPAPNKGETVYGQICQSCHQATGLGVENSFPPLKGSKWLLGDPAVPIAIVLAGLQGEIEVNGVTYAGAMQGWGMLGDEDVAAVLTYARSQWGNAAGAVTAEQVKSVREKIGSRSAWTVAELKTEFPGAGS